MGLLIISTAFIICIIFEIIGLMPQDSTPLPGILAAIWLGVLLLVSFLAAQQTAKVGRGVAAGLMASSIAGMGTSNAIAAAYILLVGPITLPSSEVIDSFRVESLAVMMILLTIIVAVIAGPIVGLVGGLFGWAIAKRRRP
jgi:hypothetical protein